MERGNAPSEDRPAGLHVDLFRFLQSGKDHMVQGALGAEVAIYSLPRRQRKTCRRVIVTCFCSSSEDSNRGTEISDETNVLVLLALVKNRLFPLVP